MHVWYPRLVPSAVAVRTGFYALLLTLTFSGAAFAASSTLEASLNTVFESIENNHLDVALKQTETIIRNNPTFRLAHLIKGDLLLARGRPLSTMGNVQSGKYPSQRDRLDELREEAIARLRAYRNRPPEDSVPRYLVQMTPEQKHAIVVDTKRSRLYVYRNDNGKPRFVADYYITHGKRGAEKTREGDQKTPLGVYHVVSQVPKNKLSDFYGSGAFPINYPNELDRMQGRNGHGIWLHGTPSNTYSRAPRASDGCVVLANADLDSLSRYLEIGLTPVIISDHVEWLSLDDWNKQRQALNQQMESWRSDWESRDTEKYLRHYAKSFSTNGQSLANWAQQKRQVNAGKTWIKLAVKDVSMFRSPGKDEVVVVTFDQDYRSNNLNNQMKKKQYWMKEDGLWKIIYEGAA